MCNSCNQCGCGNNRGNNCGNNCGCNCGCGCSLFNQVARAINNLFGNGCGCNGNGGCGCGCGCNGGRRNQGGCGCNSCNSCNSNNNTLFVNLFGQEFGVAESGSGNWNCGCNSCGGEADLTSLTGCGNQCFDAYYARQYGLYPFNRTNCCNCF